MTPQKIILIIIIIALLTGGGFYYYFKINQVNYLIPGVPYNGIYNLFFAKADYSAVSSVMDILSYWGDDRFSVSQLKQIFMVSATSTLSAVFSPLVYQSTLTIKNFFENNGYATYRWVSSGTGDELTEIKKFVNSKQKIPVIIYQQFSSSAEGLSGFRVVIGVFDDDQKVVVHDHYFGNNYEISYKDFKAMFFSDARAILVVWPSDKITGIIKGPDYNISYAPRPESMDKVGNLLVAKWLRGLNYYRLNDFKKSSEFLEEMVDNSDFQYFPPAFQVDMFSFLTLAYIDLGELDTAIDLLNNRVLPLNQNLAKPFEGWVLSSADKFVIPYFLLSQAYLEKGQRDLALVAYKEMVKLRDLNYKQTGNSALLKIQIEELEKEISSKNKIKK